MEAIEEHFDNLFSVTPLCVSSIISAYAFPLPDCLAHIATYSDTLREETRLWLGSVRGMICDTTPIADVCISLIIHYLDVNEIPTTFPRSFPLSIRSVLEGLVVAPDQLIVFPLRAEWHYLSRSQVWLPSHQRPSHKSDALLRKLLQVTTIEPVDRFTNKLLLRILESPEKPATRAISSLGRHLPVLPFLKSVQLRAGEFTFLPSGEVCLVSLCNPPAPQGGTAEERELEQKLLAERPQASMVRLGLWNPRNPFDSGRYLGESLLDFGQTLDHLGVAFNPETSTLFVVATTVPDEQCFVTIETRTTFFGTLEPFSFSSSQIWKSHDPIVQVRDDYWVKSPVELRCLVKHTPSCLSKVGGTFLTSRSCCGCTGRSMVLFDNEGRTWLWNSEAERWDRVACLEHFKKWEP